MLKNRNNYENQQSNLNKLALMNLQDSKNYLLAKLNISLIKKNLY